MSESHGQFEEALRASYRFEGRIGRGGMSTVYRARDLKHDRLVAIKAMTPTLAATIEYERFLREIRVIAGLQHPLILPLLDSGDVDGIPYYVMPFIEGESLKERLIRERRLPVEEALRIAGDALEALSYAHDHGIIHRDIKPGNLMLTSGRAVLADFGIAKALESAGGDLTATGLAVGTPFYMSPEQVSGMAAIDSRADIYAVACVLYEMIEGERAFGSGPTPAVLARQLSVAPPTISRSDVADHVVRAVERALAKEPGSRPPTAAQFAEDLGVAALSTASSASRQAVGQPGGMARFLGLRPRVAAGLAVLLVAAGALALLLIRGAASFHVADPRRSFVVVGFDTPRASEAERELVLDAAYEMTRQLNGWVSARATPQLALTGLRFDLGLDDDVLGSLADGLELGRSAGVGTLVTLQLTMRGDTAVLEASAYDTESGDVVGGPFQSLAPLDDPFRLVAPVANDLLGLGGAPPDVIETLRRQSNDLEAIRHFRRGLQALQQWDLSDAEAGFRASLVRDSAFSMPYHYLALALYWREARAGRTERLAEEIQRVSGAARRHRSGVPSRDSAHIEAFWDFQAGEYEAARATYHRLIERDSTDVYAWLMLGSLEHEDPWTRTVSGGDLRPRQDLNLALRAFNETVRLAPDFHLGYGHLADVLEAVTGPAYDGACPLFEPPGAEPLTLFSPRNPTSTIPFCPVVTDSVRWLTPAEFAAVDPDRARAGADSLLRSGFARLGRWAAYVPDQAQPVEALRDLSLAWRHALLTGTDPSPTRVDSVTRRALEHARRAMELRPDTIAADFASLGLLNLAVGGREAALELAERALELADAGGRLGGAIANIYFDRGDATRATRALRMSYTPGSMSVVGPDGEDLSFAGMEPALARLIALGALGVESAEVDEIVRDMRARWAELYDESQERALRRAALRWAGPALAHDPAALDEWLDGMDDLSAFWRAHQSRLDDPDAARALLLESVDETREGPPNAPLLYRQGFLAGRLELDSLAIALFERARRIPGSIEGVDPSWGLARLSELSEARSLEALGRAREARERYESFLQGWGDADLTLQPLIEEAAAAATRLAGGGGEE
ncbi:MAG: serine/threonine-protein kinase [Gemmatimonadota bacterium]|nr:serine/threonine-protein kinase [Gemmatimonadota bacterium]